MKDRKSIGIGLMGLGVISGQVAKVLREKADVLSEQVGCPLEIKKIKVLPHDSIIMVGFRAQTRQALAKKAAAGEDSSFIVVSRV